MLHDPVALAGRTYMRERIACLLRLHRGAYLRYPYEPRVTRRVPALDGAGEVAQPRVPEDLREHIRDRSSHADTSAQ